MTEDLILIHLPSFSSTAYNLGYLRTAINDLHTICISNKPYLLDIVKTKELVDSLKNAINNVSSGTAIASGSKVYFDPDAVFARYKFRDWALKNDIKVVRNPEKADIIICSKTLKNDFKKVCNDIEYSINLLDRVTTEHIGITTVEGSQCLLDLQKACRIYFVGTILKDVNNIDQDIPKLLQNIASNVNRSVNTMHTNSVINLLKEGKLTAVNESTELGKLLLDSLKNNPNYRIISDDSDTFKNSISKLLDYRDNFKAYNGKLIISADILANIIGTSNKVMDYDYYKRIDNMFLKGNQNDYKFAIELMTNCDLDKSKFYLFALVSDHYERIKSSGYKQSVSYKTFYQSLEELMSKSGVNYIRSFTGVSRLADYYQKEREHLDPDEFEAVKNIMIDKFNDLIKDHGGKNFIKLEFIDIKKSDEPKLPEHEQECPF